MPSACAGSSRSDERLRELALRLADFSLKGQLPSGFFYESYHLETGRWRGVRGPPPETLLSVGQSAQIAELLLILSEDLQRDGLPHEKYYLAGLRFADFFIDEKAKLCIPGGLHPARERRAVPAATEGLGGMELFFPLARIHAADREGQVQEGAGPDGQAFLGPAVGPVRTARVP